MINYVVVSNVRDEENYIAHSIKSVLNQSIIPLHYLIVNDGSTDNTERIIKKLNVSILNVITKRYDPNDINQVLAFNIGVDYMNYHYPEWEYLLKLDGDSILTFMYVELLIDRMLKDNRLGICGGKPYNEKIRLSRVTDGARLIKRECWEDIGGYDILTGFDSHALMKAVQKGWKIKTISKVKYFEIRASKHYSLKKWMIYGFMRKKFHLPFYHTFIVGIRNLFISRPYILNVPVMLLAQLVFRPKVYAPLLDKEFMGRFAINELRHFFNVVVKKVFKYGL